MQRRMLSKEDEAATGGEEIEVRREDQDKINKFSRLHQREINLEDELKGKHTAKEDLKDVSNELELADEDELIPYQIGDSFVSLPLAEVQEMLATSTEKIEEEVTALEEKLSTLREEMEELKGGIDKIHDQRQQIWLAVADCDLYDGGLYEAKAEVWQSAASLKRFYDSWGVIFTSGPPALRLAIRTVIRSFAAIWIKMSNADELFKLHYNRSLRSHPPVTNALIDSKTISIPDLGKL